jgi:hypothetical protein
MVVKSERRGIDENGRSGVYARRKTSIVSQTRIAFEPMRRASRYRALFMGPEIN